MEDVFDDRFVDLFFKFAKYVLIGVGIFLLLIVMVALFSREYPKETIIINKNSIEGFAFKGKVNGVFFPRHEITIANAFGVKTIWLSKSEWDKVEEWQTYTAKHPLYSYY